MAGGLGQKSGAMPSEVPMTTDELAKSDGHPPPTAKANRRPPRQTRKLAQSEAQSKVFEDMKKRMRATAQKELANDKIEGAPATSDNRAPSSDSLPTKPPPARMQNAPVTERSEFSISPSPPPPGRLSAAKHKRSSAIRPESVLKSRSTPTADTSVLALKNFKRRPRQPSMLAMVQQRAVSTRPSAAHAQPAEGDPEDPSVFDLDVGDEDEEEFAPDAEGTPLHLRKQKRVSGLSEKRPPSASEGIPRIVADAQSRKRKSTETTLSSSLDALRLKRQKSIAAASEPLVADVAGGADEEEFRERQEWPVPDSALAVETINSSPSSTPPTEQSNEHRRQRSFSLEMVVPSTEERDPRAEGPRSAENAIDHRDESDLQNETMADPASSSPTPDEPISTQRTDIMAEPLTQVTPPRPKRDAGKAEKRAKPMMTMTLQSLLPKRRQPPKPRHRKSEYDIDSDSDEEGAGMGEDSEGGEEGGSRNRRRTNAAAMRSRKSTAKGKTSTAARKSTAPASRRKAAVPGKKPATKTGKTYVRNATSHKEDRDAGSDFEELSDNDDSALPDTSLSMHEAALSGELAAAKAKFAEVDEWDMEFESVSFEEGRSSSQTWR